MKEKLHTEDAAGIAVLGRKQSEISNKTHFTITSTVSKKLTNSMIHDITSIPKPASASTGKDAITVTKTSLNRSPNDNKNSAPATTTPAKASNKHNLSLPLSASSSSPLNPSIIRSNNQVPTLIRALRGLPPSTTCEAKTVGKNISDETQNTLATKKVNTEASTDIQLDNDGSFRSACTIAGNELVVADDEETNAVDDTSLSSTLLTPGRSLLRKTLLEPAKGIQDLTQLKLLLSSRPSENNSETSAREMEDIDHTKEVEREVLQTPLHRIRVRKDLIVSPVAPVLETNDDDGLNMEDLFAMTQDPLHSTISCDTNLSQSTDICEPDVTHNNSSNSPPTHDQKICTITSVRSLRPTATKHARREKIVEKGTATVTAEDDNALGTVQ